MYLLLAHKHFGNLLDLDEKTKESGMTLQGQKRKLSAKLHLVRHVVREAVKEPGVELVVRCRL